MILRLWGVTYISQATIFNGNQIQGRVVDQLEELVQTDNYYIWLNISYASKIFPCVGQNLKRKQYAHTKNKPSSSLFFITVCCILHSCWQFQFWCNIDILYFIFVDSFCANIFFPLCSDIEHVVPSFGQVKDTYSEIGDVNFKGALWTFKQQLVSKMRVHCGISILLLNVFVL